LSRDRFPSTFRAMHKTPLLFALVLSCVTTTTATTPPGAATPATAGTPASAPVLASRPALADGLYAEFVTVHGTVTCELFFQKTPLTVTSFVGLAEGTLGPKPGTPYFNGLKFHRVVPDFVVQGGDPLGTGEGGPGYQFADEFTPGLRHDDIGILSMANAGPDTNGSQFFLTLKPVNRLNYLHSVFGRTIHGRELLPFIQQDDVMTAVNILRVGAAAQAFRADQAAFSALAAKARKYPHPHFDDPENLLPVEPPRARYFNFKLTNYERATGVKIFARVFSKFEPESPGQRPIDAVSDLARQLGVRNEGILAVRFSDTGKWSLWIADHLIPTLLGGQVPADAAACESAIKEAKMAFVAAANAQGEQFIAEAAKAAPPDKPLTDAQKLKCHVDAMLDGLIEKFESPSHGN
jgi:cyclophilin family peptidyl-prolyl cis-trans isomerase